MAESTIKYNGNPIYQSITLSSTSDEPIKIVETANEDYKLIGVYDANNVQRYRLEFRNGHLFFQSRNANGDNIVSRTQII